MMFNISWGNASWSVWDVSTAQNVPCLVCAPDHVGMSGVPSLLDASRSWQNIEPLNMAIPKVSVERD